MLSCQVEADTLHLSGSLRVQFLDAVQDTLRAALDQPQALTLDISGVGEVDLAGLQMLLAFLRTRQAVGPICLRGAPPFLDRALRLSGLDSQFAAFTA